MSCDAPRPRWRWGLFRPVSAALWIAGLLCTAAGVFLTSGIAGLLTPFGAILVLVGTSDGAVAALNLGSVFNLPNGSRTRVELLTKECVRLQTNMESIAQVLLSDPEAVRRTLGLTIAQVSREWTRGQGAMFSLFVLCRTIAVARDQDAIFGDGSAYDQDRERKAIKVLHDLCHASVADIAAMLDREVADIRGALVRSSPGDSR